MVRSVVVPLRRPLATKVGDFSRWPLLLVDVTTEEGITGRGYLAPYLSRAAAAVRTVLEDMGAALRGQPVAPAAAYAGARGWLGPAGYQGPALGAGRGGPELDRGAAALRRPGRPRPARRGPGDPGHARGELLRPAGDVRGDPHPGLRPGDAGPDADRRGDRVAAGRRDRRRDR